MSAVRIDRIYADFSPQDGQRVLVDRIWPRGIRKDDPRVGLWYKDVAPSHELREWYHHRSDRFDEFAARYEAELAGSLALSDLRELTRQGVVTLVSATRNLEGSHVTVLAKLLDTR